MLVDNGVRGDSRVQKAARSAAAAGWDVTLLGCSPTSAEERWHLGEARVRLLPFGGGGAGRAGVRGRLLARGGTPLRVARLARRPVEHAQVRFWGAALGDRSWRRLEPGLWAYERAFAPVIDELEPDLIHAHDTRMLGVGARAKARARAAGRDVRLVWDAHEFLPGAKPRRDNARWLPAHRAYEREYAHAADAVVTVSDTLAEMLQREHHLPARPEVLLNAPEFGEPGDDLPGLRELCGVGPDTPLLVYSGSASPQRGIATAVEAIDELPGVHLALVVEDPAKAPVHDRVHAVPYVPYDQVTRFLSGADAGLIPIHRWPNHEIALITKFFEYAHARLPIVVSDVRTMAATVRETGIGEVFRARDAADLARAVRDVLADPGGYRAVYDGPDSPLPAWTWAAQAEKLDALYQRLLGPPDVSVVLAVHDVMPYLTECLDSLAAQTIGAGRMEIVAVDDGSTDGSGAELDRFARRFPGRMTVVHQPNSGGPAQPFNRGLDAATGRYVFFVGADDRLGTEALERMVRAADEWDSDVLLGKVVGVNSRHIFQDVFARDEPDLDLFDSPLPRSLANTKLFRRSLLVSKGIRYREDMRIGSDFPFTLEACFHARRISVLTGYDFYYAVRRFTGGNITYQSRHTLRVQTAAKIVGYVAELVPAGKKRDALMVRRFDHELARLLEDDLLGLDRATQQQVHDTIGTIAADHLTDEIAARLAPETRIRLAVARDGDLDDLLAVIRQDARHGLPPTTERGGRRYAGYPGLGRLPDEDFDVTSTPDWDAKLDVTAAAWHRDELILTAMGNGAADLSAGAEEIEARVSRAGRRVEIRFDLQALIAGGDPTGRRRILSAQRGAYDPALAPGRLNATGAAGGAALRASKLEKPRPRVLLHGGRPTVVALVTDASGRLMLSVVPLNARRVAARLRF
ncbi:glycosyltransferase [Actinoplanes sp. NBRC 103695]|uniref:glycosyltransferase n=1 Tax=Actinoplanes sp. NBRC 103695 TaxID=3032202 RepID=UPI0024A1C39B|nr:glycosyltransferase [Actinoplanes sp. NBRC 103695]GLY92972.1 hypothetical protein Acsp02_02280 [Actinoplanes sp. NBRC 103695]